tara:strand:- start:249 stop:563 length:315 start_codon:yes stop_codon:yes gene_type:complete
MNSINEVEKQLAKKADAYLQQKANEIIAIRREIEQMLDIDPSFIDYITDYDKYCKAEKGDEQTYVSYHSPSVIQNKLRDELAENYKVKLVQKYTEDLLSKLDYL